MKGESISFHGLWAAVFFLNKKNSLPPPLRGGGKAVEKKMEAKEGPAIRTHKPNLGSASEATERRREENISIRKDKRAEKLKKQRVIRVEPTNSSPLAIMIEQQYNRAYLLQANGQQLQLLSQILGQINPDELDKQYDRLFGMDGAVIRMLVQAMQTEAVSVTASTCLANLTGTLTNEDARLNCAKHLMDAGIFESIRILLARTDIKNTFRGTLWTIACNFMYSCREAVRILFSSCLLQECKSPTAPLMVAIQADQREAAYPIMDILRNLLEAYQDPDPKWRINLVPEILRIAYFAMCTHVSEPLEVCMGRVQEMDSDDREMVLSCLRGLWLILRVTTEQQCAWLIMQEHPTWSMMRIFIKYTIMLEHSHMQIAIMSLCNLICAVSIEGHFIPEHLLRNNCLELFIKAAQSLNKEIQRHALFCIGSFMSESTRYVKIAMSPPFHIMNVLLPTLRHRNHVIKTGALYCVMAMFGVAEAERKDNMATTKTDCESILRTLIVEYRLFKIIMPYLNTSENVQVCMDVLTVVKSAISWNKPLVMQALELSEGVDAVGKLMNDVHALKGNQYTPLYQLAGEVDDMLSQGEMELDLDMPRVAVFGSGGQATINQGMYSF